MVNILPAKTVTIVIVVACTWSITQSAEVTNGATY